MSDRTEGDKMKPDELEEMAREIVEQNISIYIGPDRIENQIRKDWARHLIDRITGSLRTLRSKTRKEDAEIALKFNSDIRYRISQAILKKDEDEQ